MGTSCRKKKKEKEKEKEEEEEEEKEDEEKGKKKSASLSVITTAPVPRSSPGLLMWGSSAMSKSNLAMRNHLREISPLALLPKTVFGLKNLQELPIAFV